MKFQNLYEIVVNKIAMYMKPFLTLVIHFKSWRPRKDVKFSNYISLKICETNYHPLNKLDFKYITYIFKIIHKCVYMCEYIYVCIYLYALIYYMHQFVAIIILMINII